jgi:hypothetical protein
MADKTIADLPALQAVSDETLIPVYQPGAVDLAQRMSGKTFRRFAEEAVRPYSNDAVKEYAERAHQDMLAVKDALYGVEEGLEPKFIPTREEWEEYADAMAAVVASYLCNMAPGTTDCVVGAPDQDHPFVAVYNDVYSTLYMNLMKYDAVVDGITTFGHYEDTNWPPAVDGNHDTITIGDMRYPILYMNCSGFVSLLTKGRDYASSPYYRLFTDPHATPRQLASCCLEKGDTNETPWTFDCLNVMLTWRMAEILRSSGCTPFPVAERRDGIGTLHADSVGRFRDGDLLFMGNEAKNPDRYKGIGHCAMYFRDLTRLNAAAKAWGAGVTLQPCDSGSGEHGYLVHCSGSTDDKVRGTWNVLRIETMDHYVNNDLSDGGVIWGVRVASNALNSAKLHQSVTGRLLLYDCAVVNAYRHNANLDTIPINHVESMREGTQNGFFSYGPFRYSQPDSIVKPGETLDFNDYIGSRNAGVYCVWSTGVNLVNGPTAGNVTPGSAAMADPSNVYFIFETVDVSVTQGYSIQRVSVLYDKAPHTWERVVNYNKKPSRWREMCSVTNALELVARVCPEQTVTGSTVSFDDGSDRLPVKSLTVELPPVQSGSGTPAPDNVRPFLRLTALSSRRGDSAGGNGLIGKTDLTADGSEVYCGKLEQVSGKLSLTRRMVTLTGADFKGRGSSNVSGKYRFYTGVYSDADKDASLNPAKYPVCDRLASIASTDSYNAAKSGICMLGSEQRIYVYLEEMSGYTLAQFKAWVDANPLTVLYTVAEPETVSLTDKPLSTRLGDNRITAKVIAEDGTEVACDDITVTYHADPTLYIEKKIAALTAQN